MGDPRRSGRTGRGGERRPSEVAAEAGVRVAAKVLALQSRCSAGERWRGAYRGDLHVMGGAHNPAGPVRACPPPPGRTRSVRSRAGP